MPSPIAHSATGYVLAQLFPASRQPLSRHHRRDWNILYPILVANAADLDFIPQLWLADKFHRGPTHSLLFAVGFSLVLGALTLSASRSLSRSKQIFLVTLMLYGSHLLLDFFTAGGSGMKLLWPFTDAFVRSHLSFFPGVHHSEGLFHTGHLFFISVELVYSMLIILSLKKLHPLKVRKKV